MTDLAQLLVKATVFARLWKMQDGCGAHVLDELADAIEGYLGDNPFLAQAAAAKANADARRSGVTPDLVIIDDPVREVFVRDLQRVHVEIEVLGASRMRDEVIVQNRGTIGLEILHGDGTSIGLPPSARGIVPTGAVVRTPPRVLDELTVAVTEREVLAAQRARQSPADFHWITRLPDGRALFLMPWSGTGAQLSIGALGEDTFTNTWAYHPGYTDEAWRAVLGWDGIGEPDGWTRHPASGRVRPDGTPASEGIPQ